MLYLVKQTGLELGLECRAPLGCTSAGEIRLPGHSATPPQRAVTLPNDRHPKHGVQELLQLNMRHYWPPMHHGSLDGSCHTLEPLDNVTKCAEAIINFNEPMQSDHSCVSNEIGLKL